MVKNKRKRQTKKQAKAPQATKRVLKRWQWGAEATERNRNHKYLYTFETRREGFEEDDKGRKRPHTFWDRQPPLEAYDIDQIHIRLKIPEDDVRYYDKEIID